MSEFDHLKSNLDAVPLEEVAAEEARMALAPLQPRRDELIAALGKVEIQDEEDLRRAIDKVALARACREAADGKIEPVNGPYRNSSTAVRNVALGFSVPLRAAEKWVEHKISGFRERQREAAAAARNDQLAREALLRRAAGLDTPSDPERVRTADVRLESVRSDYRGQVFDRKIIKVAITDPRALPDEVLNSPGVTKALETAVRQMAKLTKNIPGATIDDDVASSVKA